MVFWEISPLSPTLYTKWCLMCGQMGNFQYFWFQFGSLVFKAMAFWEISPLALPHTQKMVSYVWSNMKFLLFPNCFGMLAVTARAFSKISLISHQNLPFVKIVKISL